MNITDIEIFDPSARYFKKAIEHGYEHNDIINKINCFTQNYTNAIGRLCEIVKNMNSHVLDNFCTKYSNTSLKPRKQDIEEFGQIAEYCNCEFINGNTKNSTHEELINVLNNIIELFEDWITFESTIAKCFDEYFENLDELEGQKFFNSIKHKYASNENFQEIIKYDACTQIISKPSHNGTRVLKMKVISNDLGLSRVLSIDLRSHIWKLSKYAKMIGKSFNFPKRFYK